MCGSLCSLLAIITKHLQRKTRRRIPLSSLRAFTLPGIKLGLKAKGKTFCGGPWLKYFLKRSQLQTAPNAHLQGIDGEEEWGQKAENFKKSGVF